MAVESDPLQVGDQVLLGAGLRTLISNSPRQLVQLRSRLADLLGGVDDVHRGLELAAAPSEVGHLHHDQAHVFGQHDDVVSFVIPLADLHRSKLFLLPNYFTAEYRELTSLSKALFSILKTSTCSLIFALSSSGNFFIASRAFVIPKIESNLPGFKLGFENQFFRNSTLQNTKVQQ